MARGKYRTSIRSILILSIAGLFQAALAASSSPFRRSRFFFFSPPKFSGGIGCRPFLGSQPGRVLFSVERGAGSVGVFSCGGFARWLFRDGT